MTKKSKDALEEFDAETLLNSFVRAADIDANHLLERLFVDHAQPLIGDAVCFKLRSFGHSGDKTDQQDICAEVAMELMVKLQAIRANPNLPPINNFRNYVITCAQNACYRHVRQKHPARCCFKNRIRYVLSRKPQFAVWSDPSEQIVCGLAAWMASRPPNATGNLSLVDPSELSSKNSALAGSTASLVGLIENVLQLCGGPVLLDNLVGKLAEICGVKEAQIVEVSDETGELLADSTPNPAKRLEQKLYLQYLWSEVCQLPLNQRLALLLNMRDGANSEALILFTETGTTTLQEIAGVLCIEFEDFIELWNQLPLDDNTIATRLGSTRQQVINLRKSARERLARRMRALEGRP